MIRRGRQHARSVVTYLVLCGTVLPIRKARGSTRTLFLRGFRVTRSTCTCEVMEPHSAVAGVCGCSLDHGTTALVSVNTIYQGDCSAAAPLPKNFGGSFNV